MALLRLALLAFIIFSLSPSFQEEINETQPFQDIYLHEDELNSSKRILEIGRNELSLLIEDKIITKEQAITIWNYLIDKLTDEQKGWILKNDNFFFGIPIFSVLILIGYCFLFKYLESISQVLKERKFFIALAILSLIRSLGTYLLSSIIEQNEAHLIAIIMYGIGISNFYMFIECIFGIIFKDSEITFSKRLFDEKYFWHYLVISGILALVSYFSCFIFSHPLSGITFIWSLCLVVENITKLLRKTVPTILHPIENLCLGILGVAFLLFGYIYRERMFMLDIGIKGKVDFSISSFLIGSVLILNQGFHFAFMKYYGLTNSYLNEDIEIYKSKERDAINQLNGQLGIKDIGLIFQMLFLELICYIGLKEKFVFLILAFQLGVFLMVYYYISGYKNSIYEYFSVVILLVQLISSFIIGQFEDTFLPQILSLNPEGILFAIVWMLIRIASLFIFAISILYKRKGNNENNNSKFSIRSIMNITIRFLKFYTLTILCIVVAEGEPYSIIRFVFSCCALAFYILPFYQNFIIESELERLLFYGMLFLSTLRLSLMTMNLYFLFEFSGVFLLATIIFSLGSRPGVSYFLYGIFVVHSLLIRSSFYVVFAFIGFFLLKMQSFYNDLSKSENRKNDGSWKNLFKKMLKIGLIFSVILVGIFIAGGWNFSLLFNLCESIIYCFQNPITNFIKAIYNDNTQLWEYHIFQYLLQNLQTLLLF